MSDIWYYAEGERTCGPVQRVELLSILRQTSNPLSVLVWQSGFDDWVAVARVRELAEHLVQPPPLRRSVEQPPPIQPRQHPTSPVDEMPTWKVKWWWYLVPFISVGIGSQVGRKLMIWNSAQRRKAKQQRQTARGELR